MKFFVCFLALSALFVSSCHQPQKRGSKSSSDKGAGISPSEKVKDVACDPRFAASKEIKTHHSDLTNLKLGQLQGVTMDGGNAYHFVSTFDVPAPSASPAP